MSSGIRTPGPIHLFGTIRGQSSMYLGTAIAAPEPEGEKFKIPVMNDWGGRSVPFQLVQDGETWMVLTSLNRFNYDNIRRLLALESGGLGGPGAESGFARGTLNIGVSDWQLTTVNLYAGTPSAGQFVGGVSDLIGGRTFASNNIRKYKESTVGTRVLEVAMAIECQNVADLTTRGFNLYRDLTPAECAPFVALIS